MASNKEEIAELVGEEKAEVGIPRVISKLSSGSHGPLLVACVTNVVATIGIVFTNKQLFHNPSFKYAQVTFAAFYFSVAGLTLFLISRPGFDLFQPKSVPFLRIPPLAAGFAFNVILPNLYFAHSSVAFYQIAGVLLTPCVVVLNYMTLKTTISRGAAIALVLACVGVGIVSFNGALGKSSGRHTTSIRGVIFFFAGVLSSAVYTIYAGAYYKTMELNSMQLLFNQAPASVLLLLYVIPFSEDMTVWPATSGETWILILAIGMMACMITLSQLIINHAGAVSSMMVGHLKTCCIVGLG
ncbi:hypothetical protein P152DRAFT_133056 [Eremomyces bilateralis CBS 781.70]|uniref:GDP-mannose transporter n=1 Tax=Eremomyces bilateralis CBS 781.70 TaxID=1392243 RepID=A0A6G1GFH0_9PEZI|nr:uncharacterized protein P152DRAFT_133056 [Eremomyces bilateralis CBS 781.70]KAF1816666.1 hypothetical protein P152DRAFT_133056 [Eremomyces bilateralis CBS 781.70]